MFPLALGLSLDVYIIGRMIFDSAALGAGLALGLLGFLMALWLAFPRRERLRQR